VKADQVGNATYNAAPTVTKSFTVSKVNQTITFGALLIGMPTVLMLARLFGLYAIVEERTCRVYVLFGRVVKTISDETRVRYVSWIREMRDYVDQRSNGQIGYLHLRAMSGDKHLGPGRFVYVFDGKTCLGHVIARGVAGFEAYTADDRVVANMKAVPRACAGRPNRLRDSALGFISAYCACPRPASNKTAPILQTRRLAWAGSARHQ
jgi:hypothetical protein